MRLVGRDGVLELTLVGYQFPHLATVPWDSNWLNVRVRVQHPQGNWTAQDPCLLTYDVAGLAVGHWQWNGWLTPKGRVVALFALLKLDAERLWLLLPDVDPEELAAQLRRFVFRSKVAIRSRMDCRVSGSFVAPEQARDADVHAFGEEPGGFR